MCDYGSAVYFGWDRGAHVLSRVEKRTSCDSWKQVKFLSEEEEEARAEYGKKQEEFLAEMANMQEALRAERAARATASADGEHLARQERQGLERYGRNIHGLPAECTEGRDEMMFVRVCALCVRASVGQVPSPRWEILSEPFLNDAIFSRIFGSQNIEISIR